MKAVVSTACPSALLCGRVALGMTLLLGLGAAQLEAAFLFSVPIESTPETSTENTGVSALITLDLVTTATGYALDLTLANTTPPEIGSRLTGVGIEWPDALGALPVFAAGGTSTYFDRLDYNVSVSPGWMNAPGGYDVIITSDGNFEGGSVQGAPKAGEAQQVRLVLASTILTFDQIKDEFVSLYKGGAGDESHTIARFQAVGPNGALSDKVMAPEPATIALLAVGTILLRRRRR